MRERPTLMQFICAAEETLKNEFHIDLADVQSSTLVDCWREGWSAQEFVDWFTGRYDLLPISAAKMPF